MIVTTDLKELAVTRALENAVQAWIEGSMDTADYMLQLAARWQHQPQSYFESE